MRRNMDLIREMLLRLEELERPHGFLGISAHGQEFSFEGISPDEVDAHMNMLFDANYIQSGTDVRGPLSGDWYFKSLTWDGRDFLDSVRDGKVWSQTKEKANNIGGWTASLLAEIAKAILKGELNKIGLPIS